MLRETPAGRTVSFVVNRNGQTVNVSAQLADRSEVARRAWEQRFNVPEPPDEAAGVPDPMDQSGPMPAMPRGFPGFGFTAPPIVGSMYTGASVDELGPQLADYFGVKSGAGLLVKSVDADSPAAHAGLKAGDVVVRVNGDAVANRIDWVREVQRNHGRTLTLNVLRNKQEQTLTLALNGHR
jgi:membrane-associated protease RseP (regulator of RpoE activity)